MSDHHRIVTVVRSTLAKRNETVGRPMSLKKVLFVWLALLIACVAGAAYFDFGAL